MPDFFNSYSVNKTEPKRTHADNAAPKRITNVGGDDLYYRVEAGVTREDNDGYLPAGESLDTPATLHLLSESTTHVVETPAPSA